MKVIIGTKKKDEAKMAAWEAEQKKLGNKILFNRPMTRSRPTLKFFAGYFSIIIKI